MSHACRPRYKGWRDTDGMDGLGEPTLGEHGVHTELLAWGHRGQLQEPLVWPWEEFRPFYPITLLFKEAVCAVQQSSAVIFMRLTAIRFPHEIYYASIIFNVCKVGETTKGNLLAYFLIIFKILMLKPFGFVFFFHCGCPAEFTKLCFQWGNRLTWKPKTLSFWLCLMNSAVYTVILSLFYFWFLTVG